MAEITTEIVAPIWPQTADGKTVFNQKSDALAPQLIDIQDDMNAYATEANALRDEVNVFRQEASDSADDSASSASSSLASAQASQSARDQAIAAVSTLPDGTVDNGEPSQVNAWSSEKVAQVTNTSSNKPIFHADFTSQTYWGWKGFENGFVSGPLSEFFTFSRSTTQTAVSPAGVIKTLAVDKPLLGWEGGRPKGVELYPAYENIFQYSEDFTQTYWGKTSGATISSSVFLAPDKNNFFQAVNESVNNLERGVFRVEFDSAGTYDSSFFVKSALRSEVQLSIFNSNEGSQSAYIDIENGTILSDPNNIVSEISKHSNGSFRVSVSRSINEASRFKVSASESQNLTYEGSDGVAFYIWGAQLTKTSYPAPYQKTEGSTVATGDSNLSLNTGQFEFDGSGDWTVSGEFVPLEFAARSVLTLSDGSSSNFISAYPRVTGSSFSWSLLTTRSGASNNYLDSTILRLENTKITIRKSGKDVSMFINGVLRGTAEMAGSDIQLNSIILSRSATGVNLIATLFKSLTIHQRALTDAECEVATS